MAGSEVAVTDAASQIIRISAKNKTSVGWLVGFPVDSSGPAADLNDADPGKFGGCF